VQITEKQHALEGLRHEAEVLEEELVAWELLSYGFSRS
jgi:hypothetical protein